MGDKQRKPTKTDRKLQPLRAENQSLRAELQEAKEALAAVHGGAQGGAVDALVIDTPEGQRIFTLQGADHAYRALIEQMSEGAVILTADGTIHYCNRGFADMLKRPLEQLIGTPTRRYVAEVDHPAFGALLRQARAGSVRGELGFLAADGRVVPAQVGLSPLVDGSPAASVSMVVTNLTERKRAELVLANAQFTRRLIDKVPIGVAVVGNDLRYILANAAYQTIAGDSAAPLVGRTIAEVFPPAVAQIVESEVQQVLRSGQTIEFREFEVPAPGRTWWNVTKIPLHDPDGNTQTVLIITEDVTERERATEELEAAKLRAEQAQADAEAASKAKDQFMAVLSHELRNPLNPVLIIGSALLEDRRFDADTREQLEVICRNAEMASRLIDDLLDVTRITRGKVELDRRPIDLRTIIRRVMDDCMPDIEARKLEFGVDLGPVPQWVDADADRLQQVFWNLLMNAIKFTHVGGRVGIRCRREGEGFVVAEVNDSGEGIDAEAIGSIFNAFEQGERSTTRQFGGLGLGLTISRSLVEMHGGSIQAHSQGKGKGATFTVRLPLLPAQAGDSATLSTSEAPPPNKPTRPVRILLVEDHGDTARAICRVLSSEGHKVRVAGDVATALRLAEEQTFDLMLSDLGLPDGSGVDLMRRLRAKGVQLPGIVLSGYGQEKDIQASREAGFTAHLSKPVSLSKLKEEIARIVGG